MPAIFFLVIVGVILMWASIKVVPEHERLAVFRSGRFRGLKGPGLVFLIPFVDRTVKVKIGSRGIVRRNLNPAGKVEVDGVILDAKVDSGQVIKTGEEVEVVSMEEYFPPDEYTPFPTGYRSLQEEMASKKGFKKGVKVRIPTK